MSEEINTQVVQTAYAAYLRGDIPGILATLDSSIVFTINGSPAVPLAGTWRGLDGMRQFFKTLTDTLEFTTFEPRDYVAQGNRVVALVHSEGRHRTTHRTFSIDSAMVWTVQNGKVVRFVEYTDTEQLARVAREGERAMGAADHM
jgi:uncharacterized protein